MATKSLAEMIMSPCNAIISGIATIQGATSTMSKQCKDEDVHDILDVATTPQLRAYDVGHVLLKGHINMDGAI